ncbi:TPA: hypothetical protein OMI73_005178 [Klebsiella pneumoniae]|uniref:hypothetical protein n=1 Tax=Klebsiella TaxID=570 RepID=UPI000C9B80C9|nr:MULTISPECIES: hypothetical protein [Klebsiella]HDT4415246.1 hypothetical protein [Klebsiella pneumoniae subsp. pneumoniae]ELA1619183.1 hypothetical protein [Klebsiella pneumoniae]MBL4376088.1 hypothetical protein [Klebsiella pneumoniae]MBN4045766.1 hypothetical protein [Klebsiella michiganensis]MBZ7800600.1 hypothetical protein [Klebsiella pneumoniae]
MNNNQEIANKGYVHHLQQTIEFSDNPVCIRANNKDFILCNQAFSDKFLIGTELTEWLSSVDFELSYKLSALDLEACIIKSGVIVEESIMISGRVWDFIITKLIIDGIIITIWQFSRIYRVTISTEKIPSDIARTIKYFKEIYSGLKESQKKNLVLYCSGASHRLISSILSISPGTSKNRIKNIQTLLSIDKKEELFIIFHISGLSLLCIRDTIQLATKEVKNLLKK